MIPMLTRSALSGVLIFIMIDVLINASDASPFCFSSHDRYYGLFINRFVLSATPLRLTSVKPSSTQWPSTARRFIT